MDRIIFSGDRYQMNWLRSDFIYSEVTVPDSLHVETSHEQQGDLVRTRIEISNTGRLPVFTSVKDISIAVPLQDKYESSEICMQECCHTHIFCGGEISYIMALRMGGDAPHLGMVLTEGSLDSYSVKRDFSKMSNDRGCFLLHPSPMEILPEEKKVISWVIFPHQGKEDFYVQAEKYRRFVRAEAESYVLFRGETAKIRVSTNFPAETAEIMDKAVASKEGSFLLEYRTDSVGEHKIEIKVGGIHTWCRIYVQEPLWELARRRCHFIVEKQQYHGKFAGLQGAFLAYDNEEEHIFYSDTYDYNGGRERVGMGMLLIEYLKESGDTDTAVLKKGLEEYTEFVIRELVNTETGEVFNDIGYDNHYERLYNWPWFAAYFIALYGLEKKTEYLEYACRIMKGFYRKGGKDFYPIELPACSLQNALEKAGMKEEKEEFLELFKIHADSLLQKGVHYPTSEVNYEQSIVAPAADILLQLYLITGEEKYLEGGKLQLKVLELFHGRQPDYHLYETAVRHWDGYWFGKKKLYGDTYPHYWSAESGNDYALYYRITGDQSYRKKAEDAVKGVLPMFFADGRASCAYLYPLSVNGAEGSFWDPYANDQDWGLYFNLRLKRWLEGLM